MRHDEQQRRVEVSRLHLARCHWQRVVDRSVAFDATESVRLLSVLPSKQDLRLFVRSTTVSMHE